MPSIKRVPDITFIVTAHSKPDALRITLGSLVLQKNIKSEILVSNNANGITRQAIRDVCRQFLNHPVREIPNDAPECYSAIEKIAPFATGKFLCFPSEEDYYTPVFAKKLLDHARRYKLHLVYCDSLYDDRIVGSYEVMRVQPRLGHIDKGGFLLRRNLFSGFPGTPDENTAASCDAYLIEKLRNDGISFGKVCEVLWVHN